MAENIYGLDWIKIPSGTMLHMKDFPSIKLLKLDNSKACYFGYDDVSQQVDIKEYTSMEHGSYYYFQTHKDDWHPLTNRLWKETYD